MSSLVFHHQPGLIVVYTMMTQCASVDEGDLWRVLREQFEFARHVLWEQPVETREEALQNDFYERKECTISRAGMGVIRYRGTARSLVNATWR
jgi:hypothetical protein